MFEVHTKTITIVSEAPYMDESNDIPNKKKS